MAGRPKKVGNTTYTPTTPEVGEQIASTNKHKKAYDRYEIKAKTHMGSKPDGTTYLRHWEFQVQLISKDKGIPSTGIMLEPYRAEFMNSRAQNSKVWMHEVGQPIPETIIRKLVEDEYGNATWEDTFKYKN